MLKLKFYTGLFFVFLFSCSNAQEIDTTFNQFLRPFANCDRKGIGEIEDKYSLMYVDVSVSDSIININYLHGDGDDKIAAKIKHAINCMDPLSLMNGEYRFIYILYTSTMQFDPMDSDLVLKLDAFRQERSIPESTPLCPVGYGYHK